MESPSSLFPNAATVHSIVQETANVYTLELHCHNEFTYLPGQYVFVCINNDAYRGNKDDIHRNDTLGRAYTLSSSPKIDNHLRLTIRRIENGVGSNWLTQHVKPGDTLWLSDAQGDFTCHNESDNYLMLAAGSGITPIMSMVRWLLHSHKAEQITVLYHVKTLADVIFAQEWQSLSATHSNLKLFIITTQEDNDLTMSGRLSEAQLRQYVPDIANKTVMCCGPEAYIQQSKTLCLALGVTEHHFHQEYFYQTTTTPSNDSTQSSLANIRVNKASLNFSVPVGTNLLYALEQHDAPVFAVCRAGVCGSCKVKVLSGEYDTTSQLALTEDEIQSGYVLSCSCQIKSDLVID